MALPIPNSNKFNNLQSNKNLNWCLIAMNERIIMSVSTIIQTKAEPTAPKWDVNRILNTIVVIAPMSEFRSTMLSLWVAIRM